MEKPEQVWGSNKTMRGKSIKMVVGSKKEKYEVLAVGGDKKWIEEK